MGKELYMTSVKNRIMGKKHKNDMWKQMNHVEKSLTRIKNHNKWIFFKSKQVVVYHFRDTGLAGFKLLHMLVLINPADNFMLCSE